MCHETPRACSWLYGTNAAPDVCTGTPGPPETPANLLLDLECQDGTLVVVQLLRPRASGKHVPLAVTRPGNDVPVDVLDRLTGTLAVIENDIEVLHPNDAGEGGRKGGQDLADPGTDVGRKGGQMWVV